MFDEWTHLLLLRVFEPLRLLPVLESSEAFGALEEFYNDGAGTTQEVVPAALAAARPAAA